MTEWVAAMREGRYQEAWALTRASLAARDPTHRDDPTLPYHLRWVWDGTDPAGRHVLVRCYHGLGDTLQFARFLPPLGVRAASLTLEVQPSLIPILCRMEGIDRIVPFDPASPVTPAECTLEITELSPALQLAPSALTAPYLAPLRPVEPSGNVGICYGAGDWDPSRSVPPALFAPLCRKHPCITLMSEQTALAVLNPSGCPFDMVETAALVAGADLVITVDTMIAHLAGAMGRPTWLLLKSDPDWRWAPGKSGSDWYPNTRLYIQPRPGDWQAVLASVERDLAARAPLLTTPAER